jgi:hypothetical protein
VAFHVPEEYRDAGPVGSTSGSFIIPGRTSRDKLFVTAHDGLEWEHVSVSKKYECPTWNEMCVVKDLFWSADDCVMQYHAPKRLYLSKDHYYLHLWRPIHAEIVMPPMYMP